MYIRDCSMVSVYPLLLFGGCDLSIDLDKGRFIISLDEGWIRFSVTSVQVSWFLVFFHRLSQWSSGPSFMALLTVSEKSCDYFQWKFLAINSFCCPDNQINAFSHWHLENCDPHRLRETLACIHVSPHNGTPRVTCWQGSRQKHTKIGMRV